MNLQELREVVDYDQGAGIFRWKQHRCSNLVGQICGNLHHTGYTRISIKKKSYLAHRLAWFYVHGVWPSEIDHRNGRKSDNRIANLRSATRNKNLANKPKHPLNTSGYKGVIWEKRRRKWMAIISVNGKQKYLGLFDDPKVAHGAYCAAAVQAFGEFARGA